MARQQYEQGRIDQAPVENFAEQKHRAQQAQHVQGSEDAQCRQRLQAREWHQEEGCRGRIRRKDYGIARGPEPVALHLLAKPRPVVELRALLPFQHHLCRGEIRREIVGNCCDGRYDVVYQCVNH